MTQLESTFGIVDIEYLKAIVEDYDKGRINPSKQRSQLIKDGIMKKSDKLKEIIQEMKDEIERRLKVESNDESDDDLTAPIDEINETKSEEMITNSDEGIKHGKTEEQDNLFHDSLDEEAKDEYEINKFNPTTIAAQFFKERTLPPCDSDKVVKLWMKGVRGGTFFKLDEFNDKFKRFMLNAINNHNPSYIKEFMKRHPCAHSKPYHNESAGLSTIDEIRGVKYLDIDHLRLSSMEELKELISKLISYFKTLRSYYILSFLPENINDRLMKNDAGAHVYVVFDANIKENMKEISSIEKLIAEDLRDSFDRHPWTSAGLNPPFCHKSVSSSDYILHPSLCVPSTIDEIKVKMEEIEFITDAQTYGEIKKDNRKWTNKSGKQHLLPGELEAIGNGFKGVEIHKVQQGKLTSGNDLGLLCVCSSIKSIGTLEECEQLESMIYNNAKLTTNARENWNDAMFNSKPSFNGRKQLWTIIKAYNPSYYQSIYPEFEAKTFTDSPYTWDMFQDDNFESPCDVVYKLKQCVARCSNGDGFILKFNHGIFKQMKLAEILASFDTIYSFPITDPDEIEEAEKNHKSMKKKQYKLRKFFTEYDYKKELAIFEDVRVYSEADNVLSLWRPPLPMKDDAVMLVQRFINYFYRQATYIRPMEEYLYSLSYKIKHPDRLLNKVFIFHGEGDDGKTFMNAAAKEIFGEFGWVVKKDAITGDMFNDWQDRALYVCIEEAKNTNKRGRDDSDELVEALKQLTTINTTRRGIHKSLRQGRNQAMLCLTTNRKDIAGLSRVDNAMYERLVIVDFKKATVESKEEVHTISKLSDLKNAIYETPQAKSFTYAFFNYLKGLTLPDSFTEDRYEGSEKDVLLAISQVSQQTYVEDWLIDIAQNNIHHKTIKSGEYAYISKNRATELFAKRLELMPTKKEHRWMQELKDIGFEIKNNSSFTGVSERVFAMKWDKWNEWYRLRSGKDDDNELAADFVEDDPDPQALN